jgi:hypothetical protein
MQTQASGQARSVRAPFQPCPAFPRFTSAFHFDHSARGNAAAYFAGLVREPSVTARAECLRRISFDRSRQKRGPPTLLV